MNNEILNILLLDRTTGRNILWANGEHDKQEEIQAAQIDSIKPRYEKVREQQKLRTKARAEIFTPPEICQLQNDTVDTAWLRNIVMPWLKDKYDLKDDSPIDKPIIDGYFEKIAAAWFWQSKISPSMPDTPAGTVVANWLDENKNLWKVYVTSPRLEITCGEAPYLVSRYNAVTGDHIPLVERRGLLDRKFNVISNHKDNESDWLRWAGVALCSVYGYEFQGDNLFLARNNVLLSLKEHFEKQFPNARLSDKILCSAAKIISWNLWQMDGRTGAIPYANANPQISLALGGEPCEPQGEIFCKIMDWRTGELVTFKDLKEGAKK